MLGRKDYTKEEIAHAKSAVAEQRAAYQALVKAGTDKKVGAALDRLEPVLFNGLVLALDRPFVHRLRVVAGKDGNPLNEVELLVESLINNDGILRANNVIKYVPDRSVLKLEIGDPIQVTAEQFTALAAAFFEDLERKFL